MSNAELTRLLAALADAIRDVPNGPEHRALTERFGAMLRHLESAGLVEPGRWDLTSRVS